MKCNFELISKDAVNDRSLWFDRAQKIVLVKDGMDAPTGKIDVRKSPNPTAKGNTVYFATTQYEAELTILN